MPESVKIILDNVKHAQYRPIAGVHDNKIWTIIGEELESAYLGKKSVKQACEIIEKSVNEVLKQEI